MANPIIELIAQNLKAAVNEVKQVNGFNEDITAIRPKIVDFDKITPVDRIAVIVQDYEVKPEEQGSGAIERHQNFVISIFVINSEDSDTALDIRRNRIRADVRKKLAEDIKRGGYAIDTDLGDSVFFDDGASFSGLTMDVIVKYRVKENDPYTIG